MAAQNQVRAAELDVCRRVFRADALKPDHGPAAIGDGWKMLFFAAGPEEVLRRARLYMHGEIRSQRPLLMRNHALAPLATLGRLEYAEPSALAIARRKSFAANRVDWPAASKDRQYPRAKPLSLPGLSTTPVFGGGQEWPMRSSDSSES